LRNLPAQVIGRRFLKVESCRQTLYHVLSVCRATEWIGCCVTVLCKEPCPSLIPSIVRCVRWFEFWKQYTFGLPKSFANFSKCMGKVSWKRGACVSGVVCLMGRDRSAQWSAVWARLSSLRSETFEKTDNSLLMRFMEFYHMFRDVFYETVTGVATFLSSSSSVVLMRLSGPRSRPTTFVFW
jgi:hypothetical protein